MIPISLSIKGLFSYQREQTIYFDRLIEGQLFGIFGAVGSGKSSILEAIAFAIYGETERLNVRDDRNYNMMNLKSDELLIDFSFVNFDDKRYRFMVKGKRNGKRFEKVNTFERTAYRYEENTWQPIPETNATSILGLSYENFRRTIIIPQGKFQEFLQLTDKARTDMLKDIFRLDKYEFFSQTASLERRNNEILQRLEGRLSAYEDVNTTLIAAAKEELEARATVLSNLTDECTKCEVQVKNLELKKQLFQELFIAKSQYEALQSKVADYEKLRTHLHDYEYCERHFKSDIQRSEELSVGIAKRNESLQEYQHKLKLCDTALMELQQEFASTTVKYQSLEQVGMKKADYLTGIELLKGKEEIKRLNERIAKGKTFFDQALSEKIRLDKEHVSLRDRIQKSKNEKPDIAMLAELKSWFTQRKIYEEQVVRSASTLKEADDSLLDMDRAIEKLMLNAFSEMPEEGKTAIKTRLLELDKLLDNQVNSIHHLQLQTKLGDFAAALHRGEACPLCGALEHPKIIAIEDVENQLTTLKSNFDGLKKEKISMEETLHGLEILESRKKDLNKRKNELIGKLDADKTALEEHLNSFVWNNFDREDAKAIEVSLDTYKVLEKAIEQLEQQLQDNEQLSKKIESDRDQYEAGIRKIVEEERIRTGSLNVLTSQLKMVKLEEIETLDEEILRGRLEDIDHEVEQVTKKYNTLQSQLQDQQQLKITLEARLNSVTESLVAERERLTFIEEQLAVSLSKSKFETLQQVYDLLVLNISIDEVRNDIDIFFQQLFNAKTSYYKLEEKLKDEQFDEEKLKYALNLLQTLKERIKKEQEHYISTKNSYERLLKQLEEKQHVLDDLQRIQQRADNLSTLRNLFKGSGFVSYISSVYLHQLCDIANKRFYKLTQQQLKLEVNEHNEFLVRDYLNDGRLRLAKTLSGGQTFQASLSLALALAESLQLQNRSKQNFFFLDEGFGSLDKESLAVAFDTLKTLRNENRVVGIISHVEELKQEIDVYLQVQNDPLTGTKVQGNWEQDALSF